MAKALQCPACGTKRRADTLAGVDSFPCATCGKVLKVPPALSAPPNSHEANSHEVGSHEAGAHEAGSHEADSREAGPGERSPVMPAPAVEPAGAPPARRRRGSRPAPAPGVTSESEGPAPRPSMVVASSATPGTVPPPPRRRRRGPESPVAPNGADPPEARGSAPDPALPAPVAAVPVDSSSTVPISAVAAGAAVAGAAVAGDPVGAAVGAGAGAAPGRAGRRMVSSAAPAATTALAPAEDDAPGPSRRERRNRAAAAPAARTPDALPVAVRIVIWVLALPIGLALVGIPARKAGYLSSQKLLDVVIKHNLDRFVPLAVIVLLWALVTAIVVHLLAEGGRAWRHKRNVERDAATRPRIVSSTPGIAPPPRRRIDGNGSGSANGAAEPQRQSRAASRGGA